MKYKWLGMSHWSLRLTLVTILNDLWPIDKYLVFCWASGYTKKWLPPITLTFSWLTTSASNWKVSPSLTSSQWVSPTTSSEVMPSGCCASWDAGITFRPIALAKDALLMLVVSSVSSVRQTGYQVYCLWGAPPYQQGRIYPPPLLEADESEQWLYDKNLARSNSHWDSGYYKYDEQTCIVCMT